MITCKGLDITTLNLANIMVQRGQRVHKKNNQTHEDSCWKGWQIESSLNIIVNLTFQIRMTWGNTTTVKMRLLQDLWEITPYITMATALLLCIWIVITSMMHDDGINFNWLLLLNSMLGITIGQVIFLWFFVLPMKSHSHSLFCYFISIICI